LQIPKKLYAVNYWGVFVMRWTQTEASALFGRD